MESKAEVKKECIMVTARDWVVGEFRGVGQTEPIHSYKMNKFCGSNAQHGGYN